MVISIVGGVLTALVTYGKNKQILADVTEEFYSWLYQTGEWNAYIDNFPEGIVNMEDLKLTQNTSMKVVLMTHRGEIGGVISDEHLCGIYPPQGYRLIRGRVALFGRSAEITVWDQVRGHNVDFAEITIQRQEGVFELTPKGGSRWLDSQSVRLAPHPYIKPDEGITALHANCEAERNKFRQTMDAAVARATIDQRRKGR